MLSIFRTNQLILGVFLLVYAFLLRFWLLLGLGPGIGNANYPILSGWLWGKLVEPYWLSALTATILVWIQAMLINSMVAGNRLSAEVNLFPGLFYILICSALPAFQDFSPFHLANTFLIMAVAQLFRVYKQNNCMDNLFNAGLLVGIASLCYGPYLLFLLPVLVGLNILRAFQSREWLAVIIGAFIPLFWLAVIAFWNDELRGQWAEWTASFGFFSIDLRNFTTVQMIGFGLFILLIVSVLGNYGANQQKTIIEVRKKIDILYWVLFFGLIATLSASGVNMAHLLIISFPAGVLLSLRMIRMSRAGAEISHLLMLLIVLVLHYLTYTEVI